MSIWGIGPIIGFAGTIVLTGSLITGHRYGFAKYGFLGREASIAVGIALLVMGLLFYGNAVFLIRTRFGEGRLIKAGVFRIVQNPMYGAFIMLLIPAVSLLVDNWFVLSTSLAAFTVFKICVKREERFLESVYGEEYNRYKKEVKQIIPFIL